MQMASLPEKVDQSSKPEPTEVHETIVDWLEQGKTLPELAKRLAKGDRRRANTLRRRFQRMVANDPLLQMAIYSRAKAGLVTAVPGTVEAVRKRAQRGRMDAAKIVLEASGVHNPRVQHEHSGEISVKLDMPRPKFIEAEAVEDAEIVDE